MPAILGIDAAWTEHGSSGVALIFGAVGRMTVISAASYGEFNEIAAKQSRRFLNQTAKSFDARELLDSAMLLCGGRIDVVAIDMPMSRTEFSSRRNADNYISKVYGRYKASTHSPNSERPGNFGASITREFATCGFPLITRKTDVRSPALIEVYPHVALIELMKCNERRKYKVDKSLTYWKGKSATDRMSMLLAEWHEIAGALRKNLGEFELDFPSGFSSLTSMKPFEDRLDAVISAWVGLRYFEGHAEPFGDDHAAIWVPN